MASIRSGPASGRYISIVPDIMFIVVPKAAPSTTSAGVSNSVSLLSPLIERRGVPLIQKQGNRRNDQRCCYKATGEVCNAFIHDLCASIIRVI